MGISLTKKELAAAAGYTYRRLYDIDQALPPEKKLFVKSEDGKYDLALFVQRWVKYNVENETRDLDDLDAVKARHEKVKTTKTELEVARMRGQMVDVQDVRRLWGDIANTVKQNLLHLASKVAPRLLMMDNAEVVASVIDFEIRGVLSALAETPLPDYAAEDQDREEESEEDDGEM